MFKKVAPYIGEYKKYTVAAVILMVLGIVANVLPYFFMYQIIAPLTRKETITASFILIRVAAIAGCEILYAVLYTQGLVYSHISAYSTLKNLRVSLQNKLEKQPLGNIRELGTGRIKKVFSDDIDQIELLLAHAIPEGIANIVIPSLIVILMFAGMQALWKAPGLEKFGFGRTFSMLCYAAYPAVASGMFLKSFSFYNSSEIVFFILFFISQLLAFNEIRRVSGGGTAN